MHPTPGLSFWQYFLTVVYLGHLLTSMQNFTEIVPGQPIQALNAKWSDGGPIEGCIS